MNVQDSYLHRDEFVLEIAERLHKIGLYHSTAFPEEVFKNPAWLVMLSLFIMNDSQTPVPISALRAANRLTESELEAAIHHLIEANLIRMLINGEVTVTPEGIVQMNTFIRQATRQLDPDSVFKA